MEVQLLEDVEQFLEQLEQPALVKVLRTIDLLEEFGSSLRAPHSKPLGKGIFELRVRGIQEVRLLYAFHKHCAVVLYGFLKKSQRIPRKEIEHASALLKALDAV